MPNSSTKSWAFVASSPMSMPTKRTSGRASLTVWNAGSSRRHGAHHVAQRLTTAGPRSSASSRTVRRRSAAATSGRGARRRRRRLRRRTRRAASSTLTARAGDARGPSRRLGAHLDGDRLVARRPRRQVSSNESPLLQGLGEIDEHHMAPRRFQRQFLVGRHVERRRDPPSSCRPMVVDGRVQRRGCGDGGIDRRTDERVVRRSSPSKYTAPTVVARWCRRGPRRRSIVDSPSASGRPSASPQALSTPALTTPRTSATKRRRCRRRVTESTGRTATPRRVRPSAPRSRRR